MEKAGRLEARGIATTDLIEFPSHDFIVSPAGVEVVQAYGKTPDVLRMAQQDGAQGVLGDISRIN